MSRWLWQSQTPNLPELWLTDQLTPQTETQLIEFSHTDPLVRTNTRDALRFASHEKIQTWLNDRELIVLETGSGDLAGIMWLSAKTLTPQLPHYQLTFGIRLYEKVRGKGLSMPFFTAALTELKKSSLAQQHPQAKLWLETKKTNTLAIDLYKRLGFTPEPKLDHDDEQVMLQSAAF